jgi:sulfite dehydrogenase (cytochrome) subunit A
MHRRTILTGLGLTGLGRAALAADPAMWMSPNLPDGTRATATLQAPTGKRPLIGLTDRPPNYESPIGTFIDPVTPNEDFFVRYHLAHLPTREQLANWSLGVGGDAADRQLTLSLADLAGGFQAHEVIAVCQCSGNRRGLSKPHVAGVEWGYGAMGAAVWRGPRLKDVLAKAGAKPGAVEIWLDGTDGPVLPSTPDFTKSLPIDKAMDDDVIIATSMNNEPLPLLNGFPARVIVPGWTATYWMKHLSAILISAKPLDNFWMKTAYRVPTGMFPVEHPFPSQDNQANWPITEMVVNSLVADPVGGSQQEAAGFTVRGVAWDRGHGIRQVEISVDAGETWTQADLGQDLGRFAFRPFSFRTGNLKPGAYTVSSRATSNSGETQSPTLTFNPAGYHNNVPQMIPVTVG